MSGILLSGWRIRLFDAAGKPLYFGRVSFFDTHSSTPKSVYADKDLTVPLGTFVSVDSDGYLPVIWLSAGLTRAVVQQRIQADPETWRDLWLIDDLGQAASVVTPGSGIMAFCANIGELKAIPAGTISAAIVAGYYDAGDAGDPMFFKWESGSTKTDDGGAFIRPSDTGVGTTGRYHQVFSSELDIRKWGGIPNTPSIDCIGPYLNMVNYASDVSNYPSNPPMIGFQGAGVYYCSGSLALDALWGTTNQRKISYHIGEGVSFTGTSLSLQNPCKIDTRQKLVEYPSGLIIGQNAVEFVRPEWMADYYGNLAGKIAQACTYKIPIKVEGDYGIVTISDEVLWTESPIEFVHSDTSFAVTGTLSITSPISSDVGQYLFRSGTITISDQIIDARWFGWGYLTGNNQGPALQSAINAANAAKIFVPRLSNSAHKILSVINGTINKIPRTLITDSIVIGTSGGLLDVFIDAPESTNLFSSSSSNQVRLLNKTIYPEWFGANTGDTTGVTNASALIKCLVAASAGGNIIDGGFKTYSLYSPISCNVSGTLSIKNITLNPSVAYNTTSHPILMAVTGTGKLYLDRVTINDTAVATIPLYLAVATSHITLCDLHNDIIYGDAVDKYTLTSTRITGEIGGSKLTSPAKSAVISNCIFEDCKVFIYGDTSIRGEFASPMINNMVVSNNIINNIDEVPLKGCIHVIARAIGTLVSGLSITNNVFGGNIPAWNNDGVTNPDYYRYRIQSNVEGTGSFVVPSTVRHRMMIRNNVYQWNLPSDDVPTPEYPNNKSGHRENYIPETIGTINDDLIVGISDKAGSTYRYTKTWNVLPRHMFVLVGDTTSGLTLAPNVIGWERKTGAGYDQLRPCDGDISIDSPTVSGGLLTADMAGTQYGNTAGVDGWVQSVMHYSLGWSIYR